MINSSSPKRNNGNPYVDVLPVPDVLEVLEQATDINEARKMVGVLARPTLITLEEAQERTGVKYGTLSRWLYDGKLKRRGRVNHPAPGGGKVLVAAEDVDYLANNRPKMGRPRKNGARTTVDKVE